MIRNVSLNFKKILFIYLQKKKAKKAKKAKKKKINTYKARKKKLQKKKKKKKIKLLKKEENIIINYTNFKFKDEFFNLKKLYLFSLPSSSSWPPLSSSSSIIIISRAEEEGGSASSLSTLIRFCFSKNIDKKF